MSQDEEVLHCDFCGCETEDPWHGSTWSNRHVHACDACRPKLLGEPVTKPPEIAFENPRVQLVYNLLCDYDEPPEGEHWEGWVSRRIVEALDNYNPCPNYVNCQGQCFVCEYYNSETQQMEYPK